MTSFQPAPTGQAISVVTYPCSRPDASQRVLTSNGSESTRTRSPPSWLLPLGTTKSESESRAEFFAEIATC
ncbi:MAG: hypothetical protein JWR32_4169 [Mycobacterium sp.]|nr:hypothetical protein [Mycobacterium sp.]